MPSNVTLTSLKIADGVLALHGPDGNERARLEGLNGELSAPALDGPYRFRGVFVSGGAEREIRLATAAPEADGRVRLRASLRLADTGATYLLDARAADLMGKIAHRRRSHGAPADRRPLAAACRKASARARKTIGAEEEHKLDKNEAAFDLKAAVKADVAGAELSDLSLTFEQDGRPQIVTGSLRANWRNELALDMNIASRWLDLDRITGASEQTGPIESIAKFSARLRDLIPGHGKAAVTLAIDQANLGHDAVGPVQLAAEAICRQARNPGAAGCAARRQPRRAARHDLRYCRPACGLRRPPCAARHEHGALPDLGHRQRPAHRRRRPTALSACARRLPRATARSPRATWSATCPGPR